jgi:hypothetical protein
MANQHYDLIIIGSGRAGVFRSLLEVRADSCRQAPGRPHRLNGTSIRPSSSAKRSFMVCLGILSPFLGGSRVFWSNYSNSYEAMEREESKWVPMAAPDASP